jgi:hypothetical protein
MMDDLLNFLNEWIRNNGTLNASDTGMLKSFMSGLGAEIDSLSIVQVQIN